MKLTISAVIFDDCISDSHGDQKYSGICVIAEDEETHNRFFMQGILDTLPLGLFIPLIKKNLTQATPPDIWETKYLPHLTSTALITTLES